MKKFVFLICSLIITVAINAQQYPGTFPFETFLDNAGNLYVTGESNSDILIQKIVGSNIQSFTYLSSDGIDKGMDIVIDGDNNIVVTGYVYNSTDGFDIIVLKYSENGTFLWAQRYDNASEDDKGVGVEVDGNNNIFLCGYVTNSDNTTDYIVIKYDDDGNLMWDEKYSLAGNEIATDILLDNNYVYVMGYKDETSTSTTFKDAMLLTYTLSGASPCTTVVNIPSTIDIPTSFVFTQMGDNNNIPPVKSKASIGGFTESIGTRQATRDYFVAHFEVNVLENANVVDWHTSWGVQGYDDISTAITTDNAGNIVVTGYYYNAGNYDFASLKYDKSYGNLIWTPVLYDYGDGNDKASSINRNGYIYAVSGYSQLNPINNFITQSFSEDINGVEDRWATAYQPDFLITDGPSFTNFGSESHVLADSSVITVVYAWNSVNSVHSIVKFESDGDIAYTVEDSLYSRPKQLSTQDIEKPQFELKQNYPNPFNPVTVINYSLPFQSSVTLKVYDLLGREVAEIVNRNQQAGSYNVKFDGSNLSSGIYIYKLTAINGNTRFEKIEKMTLIK